jgi:CRP/FNR family transcriptional regulator
LRFVNGARRMAPQASSMSNRVTLPSGIPETAALRGEAGDNVVPIHPSPFKTACASCGVRALCLPIGFDADDLHRFDPLIARRRTVRRCEALYRSGDPFRALYAVRTGFFKTCLAPTCGREQVTGFQMAGELLGLDGIASERHTSDSYALEDSQVCVIGYAELAALARELPALQQHLHRIMSREIVRDHAIMLLLGSMRAEERVAAFILNLADRLRARGFSGTRLVLRMTRGEIGSHLGLKLETVSRAFSRLQEDGLLDVRQRHVTVLDAEALGRLAHPLIG